MATSIWTFRIFSNDCCPEYFLRYAVCIVFAVALSLVIDAVSLALL